MNNTYQEEQSKSLHVWIIDGQSDIQKITEKFNLQKQINDWSIHGRELPHLLPVTGSISKNLYLDSRNQKAEVPLAHTLLQPIKEEEDDNSLPAYAMIFPSQIILHHVMQNRKLKFETRFSSVSKRGLQMQLFRIYSRNMNNMNRFFVYQ